MNTALGTELTAESLTDLHNRRSNTQYVAKRAKSMSIPFLVWPEDKFLLTLADLPVQAKNSAPDWEEFGVCWTFPVLDDKELRLMIREGYAYDIKGISDQFVRGRVYLVTEYHVKSR